MVPDAAEEVAEQMAKAARAPSVIDTSPRRACTPRTADNRRTHRRSIRPESAGPPAPAHPRAIRRRGSVATGNRPSSLQRRAIRSGDTSGLPRESRDTSVSLLPSPLASDSVVFGATFVARRVRRATAGRGGGCRGGVGRGVNWSGRVRPSANQ
ncbi:hypothetical protein AAFF_G00130920 [Aldrovandia affinis]|uniref:Uncharacterized protein n=1 Tax=Aldrovandia affinis TaxID=143900 RepID=A0AAD7RRA8_9TELE|nr:hypothetical protein AAFF_G00130920 [Aldrovandia affinis]